MKKLSLVLVAILFAVTGILAQTPNQFKYQAVLRNADGTIMANEAVTVDISILQGNASGTSVFTEQHNVTTTAQGLINLDIGSVSNLDVVDWGSNSYFMKITVNGTEMGTSQLLKVPYALQANSAENLTGTITESQISDFGTYIETESQSLLDVLIVSNNASNNAIVNVLQLGIGTIDVEDCAAMEINSTTQGFLPPRMSEFEIEQIINPVEGLMVYNTTTHNPIFHDGTNWVTYDGSVVFQEFIEYNPNSVVENEEYPLFDILDNSTMNKVYIGGYYNLSSEPLSITRIVGLSASDNIVTSITFNNLNPSSLVRIDKSTGLLNDTILLFSDITSNSFLITGYAFNGTDYDLITQYEIIKSGEIFLENENTGWIDELNFETNNIPSTSVGYENIFNLYKENIVFEYFDWVNSQKDLGVFTGAVILGLAIYITYKNWDTFSPYISDIFDNFMGHCEGGACGNKSCILDGVIDIDPFPQTVYYTDTIP